MTIRPNEEERNFGADRERQRDISGENGRANSPSNVDGQTASGTAAAPPARGRSNRGFASMDENKQREIASKGGRAAHQKGTAHEFDAGEARAAGRKGGVTVSRNREHMAAIGRRGGEARGANRAARLAQRANEAAAAQQNAAPTGVPQFRGDREVGVHNDSEQVRPSSNSVNTESRGTAFDAQNISRR